jgi:hypothetical protein
MKTIDRSDVPITSDLNLNAQTVSHDSNMLLDPSMTSTDDADERNHGPSPQPVETKQGKVGVWMLVGLTFYSVSGGPLGSEIAVQAAGPALALLGFLIMPLAWSLPEAVMTAELSTAYPEVNVDCNFLIVFSFSHLKSETMHTGPQPTFNHKIYKSPNRSISLSLSPCR